MNRLRSLLLVSLVAAGALPMAARGGAASGPPPAATTTSVGPNAPPLPRTVVPRKTDFELGFEAGERSGDFGIASTGYVLTVRRRDSVQPLVRLSVATPRSEAGVLTQGTALCSNNNRTVFSVPTEIKADVKLSHEGGSNDHNFVLDVLVSVVPDKSAPACPSAPRAAFSYYGRFDPKGMTFVVPAGRGATYDVTLVPAEAAR